ncbi:MAG: hypothetical protein ACR2LA_11200 [Acidimicrobiales bacterium]
MNRLRVIFSACLLIGSAVFGFVSPADAQQQQQRQQSARSEREVRKILQSLSAKIDDFRYRLSNDAVNNSGNNQVSDISRDVRALQDSVRAFETKFNSRRENTADVDALLDAAKAADESVNRNRLSGRNATDWAGIRASFEQLAASYNVNWRSGNDSDYSNGNGYPNDSRYPTDNRQPNNYPSPTNSYNNGLTGTYRLDTSRSEDTNEVARRATAQSNSGNDSADENDLRQKLETPEQIAVDVRGSQIMIASSRAAQITLTADGRDRTEQTANGGSVRSRATLRGQELTVSKIGNGDEDYSVTFTSIDNGKSMRVTRRVTTDYLNETVFAESFYLKTDSAARLGINGDANDSYSSSDSDANRNYPGNSGASNYPTVQNGRTGSFVVPGGVILTGTLQNDISTEFSQNNDRFRLNVTAPNEFRGAVLEGRLSGLTRSGKVSGRSQVTFNFETIRLSNGQTYDFAGFLQNVTDADGKTVKIDTEGTARGDSQTNETIKRGSIGAGVGAIIGAIAGGGKGAAIGAILGGGAGAGSVVVQGKDDLQLKAGSSITVQSSSPSR